MTLAAFEVDHARGQALGLAEVVRAHHQRHAVGGEARRSAPRPRAWPTGRGSRWARRGTGCPAAPPRRAPAPGAAAGRPTARAPAGRASSARPTRCSARSARAARSRARHAGQPQRRRAGCAHTDRRSRNGPLEHHRLARRSRRAERCAPALGAQQAVQQAQQRGLARAVGADQRDAVAALHVERHAAAAPARRRSAPSASRSDSRPASRAALIAPPPARAPLAALRPSADRPR